MENFQFLRAIPLFSRVYEDHLLQLLKVVREKKFKKGSVIFSADESGETIFIVKSGLVKICVASKGKEKTLGLLKEGDYFGEMAILSGEVRSATAEVLEDAQVLMIYKRDFVHILQKNPDMSHKIIYMLIQRLREADQQIEELTFRDAKHRTLEALKDLVQKHGKQTRIPGKKLLPLSQEEVANFAGVSRETANRVLNDLEEKKILTMKRQKITVDIEKLKVKI